MKLTAGFFVAVFLLVPSLTLAAGKTPSITITSPSGAASFARNEKAIISYATKNITRDMVAQTEIRLIAPLGAPSGYESDSTYQFALRAGATSGEFTHDWSSAIPGRYEIATELHECNPHGCDIAPAGKAVSKRSQPVYVLVDVNQSSLGLTQVGQNPGIFVTPKGTATIQPPSGWYAETFMDNVFSTSGSSGVTMAYFLDPTKINETTFIAVMVGGKDTTIDYIDRQDGSTKWKTISQRSGTFKGLPATELVQQGSKLGKLVKMKITAVEGTGKVFIFAGVSEKKDWKTYEPIFDTARETLQLK